MAGFPAVAFVEAGFAGAFAAFDLSFDLVVFADAMAKKAPPAREGLVMRGGWPPRRSFKRASEVDRKTLCGGT